MILAGDIAFRFLNYIRNDESGEPIAVVPKEDGSVKKRAHVTVCDINQAMLDVGKKRAEDTGIRSGTSQFTAALVRSCLHQSFFLPFCRLFSKAIHKLKSW